ncbi:hypothetical protein D6D13_06569 [Aureobasidium pullulans]|uniref:Uncharacterized protein n=1 Tax=Aureobasidium pullulans TaxID=5580 RepID=A0A4S9CK23_AURPU|nr:hypothetical protein D6D13_06569 [Aureobasidium pullulans]
MADNTHPMSTRRSLKTDRASIINPTAVTSHKATINPPATTTATPKATANSTPTPSRSSTRKSKVAAARNTVKPTTRSSAGGKAAVKQPPSDEAPDVEMQDEDTLPSTTPTTSTSKAAAKKLATKNPIPEEIPNSSPEVKMQDSATSPPITSPYFKPKSAMKKPAIKHSSPASTANAQLQDVESSPTSRPKARLDKPNNNPHDYLKPKASKRRTVSFGGATSEAATQTEDADIPVVQRVHDAYPNLPAGVPRDGDGIREYTLPLLNQTKVKYKRQHKHGTLAIHQEARQWTPTLTDVKMMTNEFSDAITRAKDARKCTGGDECGDHCPLFGAEGHGDWKMG